MSSYRPISETGLVALLSGQIADFTGVVRIAIDGLPGTEPHDLAAALVEPLRVLGRPVHLVRAELFWYDASLRLEYGRQDPDAYLNWLDAAALRREVLDRAVSSGSYLPSLRDPATNRATREPAQPVGPDGVLIVSGALLFGLGLPFELTVHLAMSRAARERRLPPEWAWTLPAFDRYDAEVSPVEQADVIVRVNDPRHLAVRS